MKLRIFGDDLTNASAKKKSLVTTNPTMPVLLPLSQLKISLILL